MSVTMDWSNLVWRRFMDGKKSVRFNCEQTLLEQLDAYRSRYVCRTQLIEQALRNYLKLLQ